MANETLRGPLLGRDKQFGSTGALPYLPLSLSYRDSILDTMGLLDTGASVNGLPHDVGRQLGAVWEHQTVPVLLTGNLSGFEARALVVSATIGSFAPVSLVFEWTRAEQIPMILGQINFFVEFDVCFFRRRGIEVRLSDA
jgi:hypothetical protein